MIKRRSTRLEIGCDEQTVGVSPRRRRVAWLVMGLVGLLMAACQPAAAPPTASESGQSPDSNARDTTEPASAGPASSADGSKATGAVGGKQDAASQATAPQAASATDAASGAASGAATTATTATTAAAEPFAGPLAAAELAEGWIALFDGKTLFGWQAASKANWKVEDGAITVSDGEPGLLCTGVPWSDYELRLEFRFAPGTNSGIFLHSPPKPADPKADCYELNIAEPAVSPFPTGSFVGREKGTEEAGNAKPDEWHAYEIRVQGERLEVRLDGRLALDFTDAKPLRRGLIGLQLNKGAVAFRNIKLKPLGLASLFNGQDLQGWTQPPMSKSRVAVTQDGELSLRDGKGYLESTGRFGDFVARLECKTLAANLNSGLFFRCIPGQEMNGYESQIHNGFQAGDRSKPADCGTGGVFRRVNARLVAADDLQWFTKTLNVSGPTVAVWVNGYQVTQWTDDRPMDQNPRKGLRLEAGTLQLQGHDPTTDLLFRNLQAAELPPRASP